MIRIWVSIALSMPLAVAVAGCKQGLGERCETSADCESGVCSNSEPKICVPDGQAMGMIDATLPIDAAPDAASPVGAGAGGKTDTAIDAP